jgi:hypothetical protein
MGNENTKQANTTIAPEPPRSRVTSTERSVSSYVPPRPVPPPVPRAEWPSYMREGGKVAYQQADGTKVLCTVERLDGGTAYISCDRKAGVESPAFPIRIGDPLLHKADYSVTVSKAREDRDSANRERARAAGIVCRCPGDMECYCAVLHPKLFEQKQAADKLSYESIVGIKLAQGINPFSSETPTPTTSPALGPVTTPASEGKDARPYAPGEPIKFTMDKSSSSSSEPFLPSCVLPSNGPRVGTLEEMNIHFGP